MLLLTLTAAAQCPRDVIWPGDDWASAVPTAEQTAAMGSLRALLFPAPPPEGEVESVRTNSVVLIHRGEIVYEEYAHGFTADKRHAGWSVTKSALSTMVGIAEKEGLINLDDSICDHIDIPRQENCGITIEHTLTFSTGLAWAETYADQSPRASSVANMLFGVGRRDAAAFVADHPLRAAPGTQYTYSSGDSVLLAAALAAAVTEQWGEDFLWRQLFEPIGMTSAQLSRDVAGTLLGSSGLHATPRDYGRLGYLALREGCWEGEPMVATDWMERATTVSPVFLADTSQWSGGSRPGLSWWLNTTPPTGSPPWEGVPDSAFAALGLGGQSVYVLPSHDLVVVRTADDQDNSFDRGRFLTLAMAIAEAAAPLPEPPEPEEAEDTGQEESP